MAKFNAFSESSVSESWSKSADSELDMLSRLSVVKSPLSPFRKKTRITLFFILFLSLSLSSLESIASRAGLCSRSPTVFKRQLLLNVVWVLFQDLAINSFLFFLFFLFAMQREQHHNGFASLISVCMGLGLCVCVWTRDSTGRWLNCLVSGFFSPWICIL